MGHCQTPLTQHSMLSRKKMEELSLPCHKILFYEFVSGIISQGLTLSYQQRSSHWHAIGRPWQIPSFVLLGFISLQETSTKTYPYFPQHTCATQEDQSNKSHESNSNLRESPHKKQKNLTILSDTKSQHDSKKSRRETLFKWRTAYRPPSRATGIQDELTYTLRHALGFSSALSEAHLPLKMSWAMPACPSPPTHPDRQGPNKPTSIHFLLSCAVLSMHMKAHIQQSADNSSSRTRRLHHKTSNIEHLMMTSVHSLRYAPIHS